MISLTERTILDKRTLGCICDHGTTECKDIITLFESNRGYCSVYVCNKGLRVDKADDILCHSEGVARRISFKACKRSFAYAQDDAQSTALNDAMNCHCERSEAIQFLGRGMRILTGLPRHCVARNDGATARFFGLRPLNDGLGLQEILRLTALNDGMDCHATAWLAMTDNRNITKPMHNEQNGLVVMFSSAKHHKAQETKPETDRNQIQNKLWQKQSNRNISTCVAQREVA